MTTLTIHERRNCFLDQNKVSWIWRNRNGSICSHTCELNEISLEETISESRRRAMLVGYPGHAGGWWNWFIQDFHNWLAVRGLTDCECHPKSKKG
jgi:hypothetical protein